jgi:hypothetical protein
MRELFPTEEMKIARMIAEARGNLPYDPSRIGLPAGAMTLSDLDTRTRSEVVPSPMDASYEGQITDPTLANENLTKIVPPKIIAQKHFAVMTPVRDRTVSKPPTDPALTKITLVLAGAGFVLLTIFVALISSRFFAASDEPAIEALEPPPPPPPPQQEPVAPRENPLAQIETMIADARRKPDDLERFAEISQMIQEAALPLDPHDVARINALLKKGRKDRDLAPLIQALEILKDARRRVP